MESTRDPNTMEPIRINTAENIEVKYKKNWFFFTMKWSREVKNAFYKSDFYI